MNVSRHEIDAEEKPKKNNDLLDELEKDEIEIDHHELMTSLKIAYKDKRQGGRSENRNSNRRSRQSRRFMRFSARP